MIPQSAKVRAIAIYIAIYVVLQANFEYLPGEWGYAKRAPLTRQSLFRAIPDSEQIKKLISLSRPPKEF